MPTINILLPEALRTFVEEQIAQRRYGTTSEYISVLIRRDQDRQNLRDLLLAGVASEPGSVARRQYFHDLRAEVDTTPDG